MVLLLLTRAAGFTHLISDTKEKLCLIFIILEMKRCDHARRIVTNTRKKERKSTSKTSKTLPILV